MPLAVDTSITPLSINPAVSSQESKAFYRSECIRDAIWFYLGEVIEGATTQINIGLSQEQAEFVGLKGFDEVAAKAWIERVYTVVASKSHMIFVYQNSDGYYTDAAGDILGTLETITEEGQEKIVQNLQGATPVSKTAQRVKEEMELCRKGVGYADYQLREWLNYFMPPAIDALRQAEAAIAASST